MTTDSMQELLKKEIQQLIQLRQTLHQNAEVSSKEEKTAKIIKKWFSSLNPDQVIENLGEHGLAFVYSGEQTGRTILLRCAMDGLPIQETTDLNYCSLDPLTSHSCGHDGHMTILAAVGMQLAKQRLKSGNVILLFQPAEETGQGAKQVLTDKKFQGIKPDFAFALHNLPKYPLGQVLIRSGAFNCASLGMVIELKGRTSHAAHPEHGNSPVQAVSNLMTSLQNIPSNQNLKETFSLVTLTHVQIGEESFGVAPGNAKLMAVLRADSDKALSSLAQLAETAVQDEAEKCRLDYSIAWQEAFSATINHSGACQFVEDSASQLGYPSKRLEEPFRWSEDFGEFTARYPGAMFGLGSGLNQPQLHNPDFDFPDELIVIGGKLFCDLIHLILNEKS